MEEQIQNIILKEHKFDNKIGKDKQEQVNKMQAAQNMLDIPNQNKFIIRYKIQHGTLKTDEK